MSTSFQSSNQLPVSSGGVAVRGAGDIKAMKIESYIKLRSEHLGKFLSEAVAEGDECDARELSEDIKRLDSKATRSALRWLADNMGDKSVKDAWGVAGEKRKSYLLYGAGDKRQSRKFHFWKSIDQFLGDHDVELGSGRYSRKVSSLFSDDVQTRYNA